MDRFKNEDARVLYVYFDYKAQETQTEDSVACSLVEQLACQCETLPADLVALYSECTRTNSRPRRASLMKLLGTYSQKSRIYAIFDAIDECSDAHQRMMLSLFEDLQKMKYRLLVSTRPHLLQTLQHCLSYTQTLEINANEYDLRNYITTRLKAERSRNPQLESGCFKLIEGVRGM